jgi:hypothetical protein
MEFNIDELSDFDNDFEYKNDFDYLQDNTSTPSLNSFQTIQKQQAQITPQKQPHQQPQQQQQQNKPISYDDILSNMNVCLVNGKLQFNRTDEGVKNQKPANKSVRFQPQQQQQQQQRPQQQQRNLRQNTNTAPYYQQQQQQQQAIPTQPLTPQERKRLFIIQQLQQQAKINHLNNVKSKKLLIPNPNIQSSSMMGLGGSRSTIPVDRFFRLKGI